jgi:hypothetical protein
LLHSRCGQAGIIELDFLSGARVPWALTRVQREVNESKGRRNVLFMGGFFVRKCR